MIRRPGSAWLKNESNRNDGRQDTRTLGGLSICGLLLSVSLAGALKHLGPGHSAMLSTYGAILLHEDVGGYVLAGIISFTAAVLITALCIRYREHKKGT